MKNELFKKWLAAVLCVVALGPMAALAEADSFGLGTGRDGSLTVAITGKIINSYAQVTGALAPGDTVIPVGVCIGDAACFAAGDLVMVWQTTGLVPEPSSGSNTAVDLTSDPVGRWELARLASVSGSSLVLTAPLISSYAANVTQVIRVPEYTSVTMGPGRSITAPAWDGSAGGIIAFLATGLVSNNGQINANGLGFRGGQFVDDGSGDMGCLDGDGLLDGDEDDNSNGAFDAARGEPDPNNTDTDQDGVSDGAEIQRGTNPLDGSDGDSPQDRGCSATGNSLGGTLAVLLLGPSLWRRRRSRG